MDFYSNFEYLDFDSEKFFTAILLPQKSGKFPTIVMRSPYVAHLEQKNEQEILDEYTSQHLHFLTLGYSVVIQHCRGTGKSSGAFVPYIHEREDGLNLRDYLRKQPFYNGELYLLGGSYTASLHYATAPFEDDVKGAVLEVQDNCRYRLWYRNGIMRKGHANWHFNLYKGKCNLKKNFSIDSFAQLPLLGLSKRVLSDYAEDFEKMLIAEKETDNFWKTRLGGFETKDTTVNVNIPILFTTGYNDFYIGGMFNMWNSMTYSTKQNCAMLVSPYDHGDGFNEIEGIKFPQGKRREYFGENYAADWFENIRHNKPLSYKKGKITYYRCFENTWKSDFYEGNTKNQIIRLGENKAEFYYNPLKPTAFPPEGYHNKNVYSDSQAITVVTKPFEKDVFIKGKMQAKLSISSNCSDTTFYLNISIRKNGQDYILRHDITSISNQVENYKENSIVSLTFCFDEYAFLVKKEECLRIDITSTDNNVYVSHTNNNGPYYLQKETKIATNTVYLEDSFLIIPIEE